MTLDADLPEQHIKDVVTKIFKRYQTKPIIEIERGSNVGEGFLGITAAVTVKLGDDVKYLFIKMAAENEKLRKAMFQQEIFNNEVYFYSKIHPLIDDICLKYTKKRFGVTPQCIYASVENLKECLVLDDLTKRNYKLVKSKDYFDKQHLMVTLKAYSRLHACGFILKKDAPDFFKELLLEAKSNYHIQFAKRYGFIKLADTYFDILKQHCSKDEDKDILDNIEKIRSNVMNSINAFDYTEEYSTILHMDCWRNNLMFKYKGNGAELENMKLVDFQMWAINSPVYDLLHTIHTNAPSKELLDNLDFYLNYYHSSLSEVIVSMGGNPTELFPREALFQQWRKHASYGLLYGLLITRGLIGGPDCLPNITEHILADKPLEQAFQFDLPDEDEYCQRIKVMIGYFIKNKLV